MHVLTTAVEGLADFLAKLDLAGSYDDLLHSEGIETVSLSPQFSSISSPPTEFSSLSALPRGDVR